MTAQTLLLQLVDAEWHRSSLGVAGGWAPAMSIAIAGGEHATPKGLTGRRSLREHVEEAERAGSTSRAEGLTARPDPDAPGNPTMFVFAGTP